MYTVTTFDREGYNSGTKSFDSLEDAARLLFLVTREAAGLKGEYALSLLEPPPGRGGNFVAATVGKRVVAALQGTSGVTLDEVEPYGQTIASLN